MLNYQYPLSEGIRFTGGTTSAGLYIQAPGGSEYLFTGNDGGPKYRDLSAWYHVVYAKNIDDDTGTAISTSNSRPLLERVKLWVNGDTSYRFSRF